MQSASLIRAILHALWQVVVPGPGGAAMQRDFSFHACLGPEVNQADVMELCGIHQLLDAALAGYHVTIFAYGQTGGAVRALNPKTQCMAFKQARLISAAAVDSRMHPSERVHDRQLRS